MATPGHTAQLLARLAAGATASSELEQLLGLSQSSISRMLRSLIDDGRVMASGRRKGARYALASSVRRDPEGVAMSRFVALFRGINVGKAKRLAMADLRELFESLGYSDVKTLLNSGNVVFSGKAEPSARHARRIQSAVAERLGVKSLVIVKSATDVAAVMAGNALAASMTNPSRLLVALTDDAASLLKMRSLAKTLWGDEKIHVGKHAAYVWCANGILESTAAVALLQNLGKSGTTRNWSTMEKIQVLLQAK